jgi:hypothetical protein
MINKSNKTNVFAVAAKHVSRYPSFILRGLSNGNLEDFAKHVAFAQQALCIADFHFEREHGSHVPFICLNNVDFDAETMTAIEMYNHADMDVKNLIETGKRIFGVLKTEQAINAAIGY